MPVRQPSDTPTPAERSMTVRDFLRGGYREDGSPVVVLNGGNIQGVWYPGPGNLLVVPPKARARIVNQGLSHIGVQPPAPPAFRPVPKPGGKKR